MTDMRTERGHYRHEALEEALKIAEYMRCRRGWYSWRDLATVIDRPNNEAVRKRVQRLMAVFIRLRKVRKETDVRVTFWKWNRV